MTLEQELESLREQLEAERGRRVKAEQLLQEQEVRQKEYYEAILNSLPSDLIVFDKNFRITYANSSDIRKEQLQRWELTGAAKADEILQALSDEVSNKWQQSLELVLDKKLFVETEDAVTDSNGKTRLLLRMFKPLFNAEGHVEHIVSHAVDVTELRTAQQKVSMSEGRNSAIMRAIPDLLFIVSREGVYLEVSNPSNMATLMPQEQFIGRAMADVLPPALAEELIGKMAMVLNEGGLAYFEYSVDTPSGVKHREGRVVRYEEDMVLFIVRDITDQKLAEKSLKEKNELLGQVMNTSSNLIFVKDSQGVYTFANTCFAQHFGHTPEAIMGRTDQEIHEPSDEVANFLNKDKLVLHSMETQSFEEKFTKPNGEFLWLRTVKKPFFLGAGEVHILGISTDITAEKLAKEELIKSEELHRLLSENSKDIICLHDTEGTYLYVSKAVTELLGYTPEELIGTSPYDITHPDDVKSIHRKRKQKALGARENFVAPYRKRKKDGSYVWVETNIRPILNKHGEVVQLQSSTRDITGRRKANEALLNSQKKYKDLVKYSQAYIISHDMQGRILSVNPYFMKDLLYTEEEVVGKPFSTFLAGGQDAQVEVMLHHLQDDVSFDNVLKVEGKEKQLRYLHFYSYKVEERAIEPYVIAIGYDLTERLLMEEELKQAKEAAEESARVKETFLANMSHEIRTPLHGILGMAGLLSKTPLNDQQQNYLKIIKSSSDNLLVVINDILDIEKIEAGKMHLEQIPFSVSEVVAVAFDAQKYKAEEKGLNYVLNPLPATGSVLVGDPYRLQQVLLNLLNNAIKFTDRGAVSLSTRVLEETDQAMTIEFMISDTGIGIPANKWETIFEGFTQASSSTTRKYGGTGLGLNICKSLVEMQGGRIWIESEENTGSTFHFILSYAKSVGVPESEEQQELDYSKLSHLRVLLTEDNEINVLLAEMILSGWGATVDVAFNGEEAVALATKNEYDVVLMDVQMPIMDGVEATRIIRQLPDPNKAEVPIIALTANAIQGDAEKYLQVGMDGYVSKPFEEDKLFMAINRLVHRR
ncbi:PAS domain S-box protein [Pontibacter korlensis]|uniref:Sensory/regulatory protein RpfC n=1 Tax=Pontibacter korlensis TaxID=400092 RepID=A0A0E3UZ25_9BACT|nr:PAS domain S-box protein [Pontibacter korlensis]AKD04961.1 hypothetical protein PKOR_20035 [Pontibacter korlensis]